MKMDNAMRNKALWLSVKDLKNRVNEFDNLFSEKLDCNKLSTEDYYDMMTKIERLQADLKSLFISTLQARNEFFNKK